MLQARRALVVLISVLAVLAGFTPAASARSASASAAKSAAASAVPSVKTAAVEAAASQSLGYWLVAQDGGIFSGGDATFHGSTGSVHLNRPIVGIGATPSGNGYWTVASDGGIFSFGDAAFYGSTGAIHLNRPIVGMAPTPSGRGYWLVASDGGIFSFGDAAFYGSTGAIHLNRPIVGIGATPSGRGYWLVASDGGIFSFGDAAFHGSTGAIHLNQPIVGMASSSSGRGYHLVASDGGIFSFGDAQFAGSTGAIHLNQPIVGMAATASRLGYWFVASDGGVFSFGDAGFFGSAGAMALNQSVVGMVATAPVPIAPVVPTATKLAFTTQPGNGTGGVPLATQPVVTVQTSAGATATGSTSTVNLTLTTPAGATLNCADNSKAAVAGVATFSGCDIDLAGTYALTATATGLTNATSASVTITVGVAAKLAFTTQPSGAVLSVPFGTQPHVSVLDAGGNLATGNTSSVTLTLTTPAGAVLACTGTTTKVAVAGIATFAGCNIDTAGTYTLTATDGALTTAVSTSIEITGVATKVAFTTQPSATASGGSAFAVQPVVTVQDSVGRTIIANTSSVTLTLTTPAGATLACTGTTTKAAVAGVATFAGCSIDLPGTYTLTATDGVLTTAVSSNVVVSVGGAAKLAFTTQPVGASGATAFATQPVVTVQDAGGNTVVGNTSSVTLTLTTPAGATLSCTGTTTKAAVAGVATFAGCSINLANTYTLTATDGALTAAQSDPFTITVGAATKVAFTTQPSGAVGGVSFGTQPVVAVQDAGGNTVVGNSSSVTLAITTAAGATLDCNANPQGAVAGVATFAGCDINLVGTYTLTASDGALTSAVSSSLTITVGAASKLVFTTQPGGAAGGAALATQPVVTIQDAAGNTVTTNTSNVLLALTTPAGATMGCTANPKAAVAGVATFAGCNVDLANTYTLTATDGALTTAVSSSFTVTLGTAAKLAFTTQPVGASGATAFATQPVVTIQDAGGNTVTGNVTAVTLTITTPAGATLACTGTTTKSAVAGVATFAGCNIDHAGSYTLTATDGLLTTAVSSSLTITVGAATKLAFTTQPSGAVGGVAFATQPVVTVRDAGDNTVTGDTSTVALTITTPGGATLACTTSNSRVAAAGVATFSGCNINLVGTYTLTATDGSLTTAVSSSLTITVGAAAKLAFTTQPVGATGGLPFATQPVVKVQDAAGNTVTTDTSNVVLTIPIGSTLTCTNNTVAAVAGVATFAACNIDHAGTYTITATDGALTVATSGSVTITVGVAAKVAFTTQPVGSTGGAAFATQPVVAVQDAGGNTVTTDTSSVVLTITTPAGATLGCTGTTTKVAVAGVATFAGCNVDLAGSYTLTASDAALATAVSSSLTITVGTASKLAFTTQPSGAVGGVAFGTQPVVKIQDAGGNTVTSNSTAVTLTITTPAGATLACNTNPQGAVAGIATFAGCNINFVGTYTLTATDGALTTAVSSSLTITVGAAAKVVFTTPPSATATGGTAFATQPVVAVQDAAGNTVTANTTDVLLTITTPAGAILTCTANPKTAVAGVSTFAACRIDKIGTYTLTASDGALTTAVSPDVVVSVGVAAKLAVTTQPGASTGGVDFPTQPVVTVQDAGGNTVTSNTSSVLLAITTPNGATLSCTNNPQGAVAGVATFAGCDINLASTYTLTATDGSLTAAVSGSLVISVGAAVKLGFILQPVGSSVNSDFPTQPVVAIQDAGGNTVSSNTSSVTLVLTTPAGATLSCSVNPRSAVGGLASFAGCQINNAGTYTLTATDGSLTAAISNNVTVV